MDAVPARCAQLLADGKADCALVPVIEYQRIDGSRLVPGVCVGAHDAVRSVVLATEADDLKDIRSVALDKSSRTSAALVQIIFREFIATEPRWATSTPDLKQMLAENDAALMIGDPGMTFEREGLNVFDLGSIWRQYTGRGFVFAMWMVANDIPPPEQIDFVAACEEGLASWEQIIDFYQPLLGLSRQELFNYLHENISFSLDDELRTGLELYYQLAHKHGLIAALKPLNL